MLLNGNTKVLREALNNGFSAQAILIQGYRTKEGKLTDVILDTSANYMQLTQASFAFCSVLNLRAISEQTGVPMDVCEIALAEVKASLNETIEKGAGNNSAYNHGADAREGEETFELLSHGVKLHKVSGNLHVSGVLISENIREEGTYKTVNSAPKTRAKDAIRRLLPLSKLRQYKLTAENIEQVVVGNKIFGQADFR